MGLRITGQVDPPVNVLVVDDNAGLRRLVRMTLSLEAEIGEVREAGDGDAAIKVCRDFQPDVVLLDYWMPVMDGETAADSIRGLHPNVRIIAYSAVLTAKPEWADAYVPKDGLPDADLFVQLSRDGRLGSDADRRLGPG